MTAEHAPPSTASLEHLRTLAIGYYVFAALGVFALLFVIGHFVCKRPPPASSFLM